jgi:nucleotide-binding universal stress UspA family protein
MTATSVVIGVDFSPALSRAGEWIRRYIAPNASITLVHAYEPSPVPAFLRHLLPGDATTARRHVAQLERDLVAWREENGIPDAACVVRAEPAHLLIQRVARDVDADLMVIGARTESDRPWLRLGSTAERLLRAADASVLVIHGRPQTPPRKILVAVDDVAITPAVLSVAGEIANRFDASIHAVHVLSNAAYSHVLSIEAATSRTPAEAQVKVGMDMASESLRWLRELWHDTQRRDGLEVEIPHGVPATEILAAAARVGAELIVIGRYGVGRVVPAVLGSVVGSIAHGATCPVLVVADERRAAEPLAQSHAKSRLRQRATR